MWNEGITSERSTEASVYPMNQTSSYCSIVIEDANTSCSGYFEIKAICHV